MKVLVIGGTLFIGHSLVEELVKAGHDVTVLHRKPRHDFGRRVENLMADRNDGEAMREALSGRRFEVVFDNAYDWERGTTAAQVEATVRAAGDRLSRYIFMSSVSAYGDGLNHKESDPLAPDSHANPYTSNKASTERLLFRMRAQHGFPVVTFRPPFVYGPNNPYYREQFFWDRLRAGRSVIIPGDGYRLMQFVYVDDLVQAMLCAMTEPRGFQYRRREAARAGGCGRSLGQGRWRRSHASPRAARHDPTGRRQRFRGAVLLRRVFRRAADHHVHGQGRAHIESERHALRNRPERHLPLVHQKPQTAHCRLRLRR
jgi:nucleoside-diphosphate-sugar epimerase